MDLSPQAGFLKNMKVNRYENDFTDMEKIGRGGYASVYKARNKVDGHFYAIKKIKLRMKDVKKNFNRELLRVLDEAKYLAEVNHQNILRYYNSWLEVTTKPQKPNLKILRVPSDTKGDSEGVEDSARAEDSDEDTTFFAFDRSNKEPPKLDSKKFEKGQRALYENRKNTFFLKISETFSNRSLSEDVEKNPSFRSEEEAPARPKTKEKGSLTPRTGDEILDSMTLYIQTELCNETLEDYISKRNEHLQRLKAHSPKKYQEEKRTYYKEAVVFAKQILSGLSHIHSHFIVHRDLKPSNIFLVNKTLKIGDFGLVKRLNSFSPIESSPFMVSSAEREDEAFDGFRLDNSNSPIGRDRFQQSPEIIFQKNYSEPANANQQEPDFYLEVEESITKSVGTRTFASPEQLKADKEKFDQRADIFSLGIIYLLLFYPMTTIMEQNKIIKESKKGKIPKILEQELPEIAKIIKKMLSDHPSDRPSLQLIPRSLVLPIEMQSDLTGALNIRRENSFTWRKKYFKLIDNNLYLFSHEADSKAESVYNLSQWRIQFKGRDSEEATCLSTDEDNNSLEGEEGGCKKPLPYIALENPMQLGCIFTAESYNQTLEIYKKFQNLETSAQ